MNDLYLTILILIFFILIKYTKHIQYKTNKPIGDMGESLVKRELDKLDNSYIVYNNVKYPKIQIDHMVIHRASQSIFVIETKNWRGTITGRYRDKKWVQTKNNSTRYLDNPIKQNDTHCRHIRRVYKNYKVYNIVVFINNSSVPKYKNIIQLDELTKYIIQASNPSNLSSNSIPIGIQTDWKSTMP